ncbi:MAG: response regulator transcription factor [Opitutaceae bacterium]
MKRILIVDDEADVTDLLTYHLRAKGFDAQSINNPNQIMDYARTFSPDLVILDVMMPELNGIQICRMLREDRKLKRIPIIFLSARTEEEDRIQGLEVGGDDYICKPFSPKELVLRVQSIFRRMDEGEGAEELKQLQVGRIFIDVEHHQVRVGDQPIELTATEFKLLKALMERKGRVQPRDQLLLKVWKYETEIETRTVDTHIRRLREKIGSEAGLIETIRGVGYRMVEPCPT